MPRRRKRRSRNKKRDAIQTGKRTSSAGANFMSFILGMATTAVLCMWGYTVINTESVQADIAPTPLAQNDTQNDKFSSDGYDEIAALMDSDNVSVAVAKLADLNDWPRAAELPVRVSANRDREKVAKKILRMDGLKESDRVFAIDSLIEALSAIYGLDYYYNLGDRQVSVQLREVAESHVNDTNAQVVRAAELAILKHDAFEHVKLKAPSDESYQTLESTLLKVLDRYKNDNFALSNIRLIFKHFGRSKPDLSLKLTELLQAKRREFAGSKVEQLVADLTDAAILQQTRYATMFENRWVNGQAGRDQLLRVSRKLLANKSAGRSVIEKVDQVAQWFEQQNKIGRARQIYRAMLDEADRSDSPIAMRTAKTLGQNGLTRCDAIGQPAVFSGVDIEGRPLTRQRFSGRIVAVIFWSVKDAGAKEELLKLHKERTQYSSLPADVVDVCIERNPGKEFAETVQNLTRFKSCNPAKYGADGVPFTKQVPITRVPQILLIDQQGNISDTNVPSDNLRSHIEHLASQR